MSVDDFNKQYKMDKKKSLGSGAYGKIFKAHKIKDPSVEIALKIIDKKGMSKADLEGFDLEVAIMQKVDHPNIVKYFESYENKRYIFLCMELLTGGEILSKVIDDSKPMNES